MALKIRLKPDEKILIGRAVVTNGPKASEFYIENTVPLLREKDIMKEDAATTPVRRLYFLVQLMYVDEPNLASYHHAYWNLVKEIVAAAPSTTPLITQLSDLILAGDYYKALKTARSLIEYEESLLAQTTGLPQQSD